MSDSRAHSFSRRGFLSAGGAVALGALVSACGGSSDSATAKPGEGGAWSFTDDRKKTVSLKAKPKRIVAYIGTAAILHDYGLSDLIVGTFGPAKLKDGSRDPQAGDFDVNKATIIGNAYGEFNIEKYAALRPDLLVDHVFVGDQLFYVPAKSKDKIFALAPSVGISTGQASLPKCIENYAALAASLGADLKSAPIAEAKARFDRAAQAVRDAAKANPGLKVLAGAGMADKFYVSSPAKNSDIMYFKELGVDLVVPKNVDKDGYFEALSWENADAYKADVIMLDARTQSLQPPALASKPTWKDLPAVKANQVIQWHPEPRFSWAGCAIILEGLAETIKKAKKVS